MVDWEHCRSFQVTALYSNSLLVSELRRRHHSHSQTYSIQIAETACVNAVTEMNIPTGTGPRVTELQSQLSLHAQSIRDSLPDLVEDIAEDILTECTSSDALLKAAARLDEAAEANVELEVKVPVVV